MHNLLMCISVISKALAQADVSAQSLSTGYGLYVCIIIAPLLKKQTNKTKKQGAGEFQRCTVIKYHNQHWVRVVGVMPILLSGEPDYFGRNKISSGGDLSHYSSASLY